jgi:hypothetical protein
MSADIGFIERMWRERFGLDVSPIEKLKIYLLDYENWEWDGIDSAYYTSFPEFTIKIMSDEDEKEREKIVWWDGFPWDEPLLQHSYQFYYHATSLTKLNVIHCHRESFSFPYPDVDYIIIDNSEDPTAENTYSFFYYKKDSLEYSLLFHLFMGNSFPIQSFTKPTTNKLPFIQFENKGSKENFKLILKAHLNQFFEKHIDFPRKKRGEKMLEEEKEFAYWSYHLYLSLTN